MRGLLHWRQYLSEPLLFEAANDADKQAVFRRFVSVVHLEISNFCNRSCVYCTNSRVVSRRGETHPRAETFFLKSLAHLKKIDYCEYIDFNGFNEPLADRELFFRRIGQLKSALPSAKLLINTNGDYLDSEYMAAVVDAGVDFMVITLHLNSAELELDSEGRRVKADKFFQRPDQVTFKCCPELGIFNAAIGNMRIALRVADFIDNGHNFGGMVKDRVRRKLPCVVPVKHVYVDYKGRVNLCCSANMDAPEFTDFSVGDTEDADLFDLHLSPKAQAIRESTIEMFEVLCVVASAMLNWIISVFLKPCIIHIRNCCSFRIDSQGKTYP